MAQAMGLSCAVQIGTYILPAVLNACSPDIQLNTRAVLAAQGQSTALIGYVPGANAKSGFLLTVKIPYRQGAVKAATIINGILSSAGNDVTMQFGTAGGVKILSCIAFASVLSGTEGQDITLQLTMESTNYCTVAATVTPPGSFDKVWGFQDVTSFTAPSSTVYTKLNRWALRLNRQRAAYVGNSPVGFPQALGIPYTETMLEAEYLKLNDAETTFFIGSGTPNYVQTAANAVVVLTQINPPAGQTTPAIDVLTITASLCFYDVEPKNVGAETEWLREAVVAKAQAGAFTIVSA